MLRFFARPATPNPSVYAFSRRRDALNAPSSPDTLPALRTLV